MATIAANSGAMALVPTAAPTAPVAPKSAMSADQVRTAARNFEAFFLARTLEPMFAGIETEAPFGGGMAEELWRSLLVDEYGKAMAKNGGIGMADAMVRSLIGLQEDHSPSAPGSKDTGPSAFSSDMSATTEIERP